MCLYVRANGKEEERRKRTETTYILAPLDAGERSRVFFSFASLHFSSFCFHRLFICLSVVFFFVLVFLFLLLIFGRLPVTLMPFLVRIYTQLTIGLEQRCTRISWSSVVCLDRIVCFEQKGKEKQKVLLCRLFEFNLVNFLCLSAQILFVYRFKTNGKNGIQN